MIKKFLCKIGIHCWHVVDTQIADEIAHEYYTSQGKNWNIKDFYFTLGGDAKYLEKKVCLRCNKIKDEVENFKFRVFQDDRRNIIAKQKFIEESRKIKA